MAYYEYGQDILQDVLFRCGEPTDLTGGTVSDYLSAAKAYVQRSYQDIIGLHPWPWALKDPPGILNVEAKKTNTATISQGGTSLTLGTSISDSVAGWWVKIDSENVPYRITAHTAGTTAITIDATYKETSASASACTIFKDEYDLASDCRKVWRAWDRNSPTRDIEVIQPGEMHQLHTRRSVSGVGSIWMSVVRDKIARLSPWPVTDDVTIEYDYTVECDTDLTFDEGTDDVPIVPAVDRHVISDAATVLLMLDKNDKRAQSIADLASGKINTMVTTYITTGKFKRYTKRGQGVWG